MARKRSLVDLYGTLPAGMSKADVEAVWQFLYGAFDGKTAKQVKILHPHVDESDTPPPELSVFEFCRWLQAATA